MRFKPLLLVFFLSSFLLISLLLKDYLDFLRLSDSQNYSQNNFDAIVVLTGGPNRINEGFKLLENNFSKKIFISGVNPIVKKTDLKKIINKNDDPEKDSLIDCCLYLGKKATNTKTNAIEVINWMSINNLNSAILVTSDIHMPRSILEFQNNANHIRITPWPVSSDNLNWQNFLTEYLRFSLVRIRYLIL